MLKLKYGYGLTEAGCDEAGRGCLAGPVFAAAVILPKTWRCNKLDDSKKLPAEDREWLKKKIERKAIAWAVACVNQSEIDRINILQASIKGMHMALSRLSVTPDCILVDGNYFHEYQNIPHHCIIAGDSKYASIAAASILAKTYRDSYMRCLNNLYPQYHWHTNVGYSTPEHRGALKSNGRSPFHRYSFNSCSLAQVG